MRLSLHLLADDLGETKNLAAAMPEKLITNGRSTPDPSQKNNVEVTRHPRTAKAKVAPQGETK